MLRKLLSSFSISCFYSLIPRKLVPSKNYSNSIRIQRFLLYKIKLRSNSLIQSICHEITESKTTYSFISYKLSHQFRYQSMSSWGEAEDGDCSVNLAPLALLWGGHGMVPWQWMVVLVIFPCKIASWWG